jgi:hypothetical protein
MIVTVLGLIATGGGALGAELREQIDALLKESEAVYSAGERIVGVAPRTKRDVDILFEREGRAFQVKELAYQKSFRPLLEGAVRSLPAEMAEVVIRIGQFDNFIFSAVGAVYSCNMRQARFDLLVSRQILDRAQLAFKGKPQRDWAPDLDAAPEQRVECRGG